MPSFDIVSEVDRQEVRNAVDQAQRELETRFDFKGTDSSIEQKDLVLTLRSASDDRLRAVKQVVEERLVKRNVSLKGLDWGKVEEAASATVRQVVTITVGINADKAREINRMIKEKGPKGVSSQTQGEQVRWRDVLAGVIDIDQRRDQHLIDRAQAAECRGIGAEIRVAAQRVERHCYPNERKRLLKVTVTLQPACFQGRRSSILLAG